MWKMVLMSRTNRLFVKLYKNTEYVSHLTGHDDNIKILNKILNMRL